jgi:flagellar motor protein MotB
MRRGWLVAGAICVVGVASGCASSRGKDRMKVLEAENIDLRQQRDGLSDQLRGAHGEHDRAVARVQEAEAEIQGLRAQASRGEHAMGRLQEAEKALARAQTDLRMTSQRYQELLARQAAQQPRMPAPSSPGALAYRESPQLEAFRRDLTAALARHNVTGMPVEIRTTQDGSRRVAIVLQNSFPAGSDNMSSNADAVRAVVNLGKMITTSYPRSRVVVEGHTDSDPIRKSKWASNEALADARASTVKNYLERAGVPAGQVSTVGMGARQPIASGSTARAKAQNRRVEIYIDPNG